MIGSTHGETVVRPSTFDAKAVATLSHQSLQKASADAARVRDYFDVRHVPHGRLAESEKRRDIPIPCRLRERLFHARAGSSLSVPIF